MKKGWLLFAFCSAVVGCSTSPMKGNANRIDPCASKITTAQVTFQYIGIRYGMHRQGPEG